MWESFTWRTGIKHIVLGVIFASLLSVVALGLVGREVENRYVFEEDLGRFILLTGFVALGASAAWQAGRSKLTKGLLVGWTLLVIAAAAMVAVAVT